MTTPPDFSFLPAHLKNRVGSPSNSVSETLPPYEESRRTPCDVLCGEQDDHIAQFWETEEHLFDVIVSFVAPALTARDAAVIVARQHHLKAVEALLSSREFNVEKRKLRGQLTLIDADEVLQDLQADDGTISAHAFQEIIGSLIRRLERQFGGRLHIYGEIVDVLSSSGSYQMAIDLEKLWNDLQRQHAFTLLCGYNLNYFRHEHQQEAYIQVCQSHTTVTPSKRVDEDLANTTEDQNVMIAMLQQKVKALEEEVEHRRATGVALHNSLRTLSNHAQTAIVRERDEYHTLLSILPVGVYGTALGDEDDYFINNRFCEIVGRSRTEIKINGWMDAVHHDDLQRMSGCWPFAKCQQCLESTKCRCEYRLVRRDGSIRWVAAETVTNCDDQGNVKGFVHTVLDITELKNVEQERLEAKEAAEEHQRRRAEEAERYKQQQEQWIDSLCHELRNPLNGISGNVELLEMGLDARRLSLEHDAVTEEGVRALRHQLSLDHESVFAISKCVAHQRNVTDDVLNLSKLELGKIQLLNVEFDPKATVSDVAKMFEAQATRKELDLRLTLPLSDMRIKGDPHRLSQVVVNILSNALKFTEQGMINLSLSVIEKQPDHTLLSVSIADTGIGMTHDEQAMLFQRFAQPSSTRSHQYGGSGLGLYISKGLVELMGGTIAVESKKGIGTEFRFTFKAEPVTVSPLPQYNIQFPLSRLSKPIEDVEKDKSRHIHTILVVEDNELNQKIMTRFLESMSYKVLVANNGQEAVSQYTKADLIFMDIQMPLMDGLTATAEIRRLERLRPDFTGSCVPIIGLSGNAREDHVSSALKRGMDEYIVKPVKKARIHQVLEQFEGHKRL